MTTQQFPIQYNRPGPITHPAIFAEMYRAGVRVFHVDATCADDIYHPPLRAWVAPGKFDWSAQDEAWRKLIAVAPDVKFCLRLYVAPPQWWDDAHPDELQVYADGSRETSFAWTERRTIPSVASAMWRRDACASLTAMLDWLDESGWSERVWGLFPCFGITWEWGILGTDALPDYSAPMLARFRTWLSERYGSDDVLQAAWGDPTATFATAAIPTRDARFRADGDVRAFPRDRASFDYQQCLSDENADLLIALGRTAREHAGDRYKLGSFYGYTLSAREHSPIMGRLGPGGLTGGQHALKRVEDSGVFDFLGSPYLYSNRDLGEGSLTEHLPTRSVQANDIAIYCENDLSTYTNPGNAGTTVSRGCTDNVRDGILHQRLALGSALAKGISYWLCDLTASHRTGIENSNYSDPEILAECARHIKLFEQYGERGVRSAAQIAIVLDERAIDVIGLDSKLFLDEVYKQIPAWSWCGALHDVWLASDVTAERMRQYKLAYVFSPLPAGETQREDHLIAALCNSGRTVWFAPQNWHASYIAPAADGDWRLLTQSCAGLDWQALQRIAANSGVAVLAPDRVHVMAGVGDRLAVLCAHVRDVGEYEIRFPAEFAGRRCTELFSGRECATAKPIRWTFEERGVAVWIGQGLMP